MSIRTARERAFVLEQRHHSHDLALNGSIGIVGMVELAHGTIRSGVNFAVSCKEDTWEQVRALQHGQLEQHLRKF